MKSEEQLVRDGVADPLVEAVTAAAAQISLALQEAQPSVEQLGASVSRMIVTLGSIGAIPEGREGPALDAVAHQLTGAALIELRRDAAKATVTLQFYDRMTQNLTHLHDYLTGVGELLANASEARLDGAAGDQPNRSSPEWQQLRESLLRRLIPHSQRLPVHEQDPAGSDSRSCIETGRRQQVSMSAIELF